MTARFDVVIVGAGIGGAVLALDLGRRGWRIALVERETTPPGAATTPHPPVGHLLPSRGEKATP